MSPSVNDSAPSDRPNFQQKKKLAKELLRAVRDLDERAALRFTWNMDRFRRRKAADVWHAGVTLADAQHVVARESGFDSWPKLKTYVDLLDSVPDGPANLFEQAVRATIQGDAVGLATLLEREPAIATMRSARSHGAVLWHYVAANGVEDEHQRTAKNAAEIAELLSRHGGSEVIDATAGFYGGGPGSTPLVALVTSGHPAEAGVQADLVHVFCRAGAKVNGVDDDGLPLASALAFRYPPAAQALADNGARIDNPVFAAALGRTDLLKQMLAASVDSGRRRWRLANPFAHLWDVHPDDDHVIVQQALASAAMAGRVESVELLLRHGVDVNAGPDRHMTALHEAALKGYRDVVRILLDHGARADIRDRQWDSTAVGWADEGGHGQLVELLLASRHVDLLDAVQHRRLDLVRSKLQADPTLVDGTGKNGAPLQRAAWQGDLEMIELLLNAGADPQLKTASGHTPEQLAHRAGHADAALKIRQATSG